MRDVITFWVFTIMLMFLISTNGVASVHAPEVKKDARCPVCGMFVKKYPSWITQLISADGDIQVFDGVKDMMAYYFTPDQYGNSNEITVTSVLVKDYYQQEWIDGTAAFYVLGSDVYGPMGHELIPFQSRAAAENFMKDHKGKELLGFSDISLDLINRMRQGHKMKGHNKK